MWDFFNSISDFFFDLFSNDPEAVKKRRELREIYENLRASRYKVFDKKNEMVTPILAQGYYQLYQYLAPLYNIFSKTIAHEDKKFSEKYLQYLLESHFLGDVTERRLALSYENIKNRISTSSDPDKEARLISGEYSTLLEELKKQNKSRINQEMNELLILSSLTTHNFISFFANFGWKMNAQADQQKPKFHGVMGEDVLQDLLDLYYLVAKLVISPLLEKGLFILLERLSPGQLAQNQKKLQKILSKVSTMLQHQCSPYLLLNLIRAIKLDPGFTPEVHHGNHDYADEYIQEFSNHFQRDQERALREKSESVVAKDIQALFSGAPLLELTHYSGKSSQDLMDSGLPGLKHTKAYSILLSYCESILKNNLMPGVQKIMVDAFFEVSDFGTRLTNYYYAAEQIPARIRKFDAVVSDEGKNSLHGLEKYKDPRKQNKTGMVIAGRIVDNLDKFALNNLEKEIALVYSFASIVGEILRDYKNPTPKIISNIKSLGGDKNRQLIEKLLEGYNQTNLFLKIMKNFVILKKSDTPPV